MKTEQKELKVICKATERSFKRKFEGKVIFNCGTTSEKMMGNDYNFKESEIACIIHKRERAKARFRLVKLERAQGECLGTESR